MAYGVWRSLVARTAGGREVAGSNPVTPTQRMLICSASFYFVSYFVSYMAEK